jgi:hypothetical protein
VIRADDATLGVEEQPVCGGVVAGSLARGQGLDDPASAELDYDLKSVCGGRLGVGGALKVLEV